MKYATIVADPPWDYPGGVSAGGTPGTKPKTFRLPYDAMTLDEIKALPVGDTAADDAWLFCWTTNRYLAAAFDVVAAWGFSYRQMIVWNKPGASPFGGTFAHNAAEYLLGCAKGEPRTIGRWPTGTVITHNRQGAGGHSRKPEVFLDFVEAVAPGPYLEMFSRRNRLGWDTWGNQALGGTDLLAA